MHFLVLSRWRQCRPPIEDWAKLAGQHVRCVLHLGANFISHHYNFNKVSLNVKEVCT